MPRVWCWKPFFLDMPWYRRFKLYKRGQCQSRPGWKYIFHFNREYTNPAMTRWRRRNLAWHLNRQPIYTWKLEPLPFIDVKVTLNATAYRKLVQSTKKDLEPRTVQVTTVADTGAQTSKAGEDILMKLGHSHNSLLYTTHCLCAVNDSSLPIKWALITPISHGSETCSETIYICLKVKSLYISQTAFKKLRHIIFTNPSTHVGYDTRSIFKQSLTSLNSEFFFS